MAIKNLIKLHVLSLIWKLPVRLLHFLLTITLDISFIFLWKDHQLDIIAKVIVMNNY